MYNEILLKMCMSTIFKKKKINEKRVNRLPKKLNKNKFT